MLCKYQQIFSGESKHAQPPLILLTEMQATHLFQVVFKTILIKRLALVKLIDTRLL